MGRSPGRIAAGSGAGLAAQRLARARETEAQIDVEGAEQRQVENAKAGSPGDPLKASRQFAGGGRSGHEPQVPLVLAQIGMVDAWLVADDCSHLLDPVFGHRDGGERRGILPCLAALWRPPA